MARNESSKSTKELILDAAFSFCGAPRLKEFSLSEVAAKVGISKTAIYRHFKSKEDLYNAMEEQLFDSLAEHLKVDDKNYNSKVPFFHLIDFFQEKTCYIDYFVNRLCSEKNYEQRCFVEIRKRIQHPLIELSTPISSSVTEITQSEELYTRHVFCGVSIFYFVKLQEQLLCNSIIKDIPEDNSKRLVSLMLNGLSGTVEKDSIFNLKKPEESRLEELNKICSIDSCELPEEDRFFTALANVIKKNNLTGVTVERIASELNMAKSSLYEYFDNRNQLIVSLIEREVALLRTIIIENSLEAKNFSEYIYVLMRTVYEYFSKRASLLPICGWILMNSGEQTLKHQNCDEDRIDDYWTKQIPEFIFSTKAEEKIPSKILLGWIWSVSIGQLVENSKFNLSSEKNENCFKYMFNFVINGIENNKIAAATGGADE